MYTRHVGMLAAAVLLATPLAAQEMPKPAAEMSQLSYFEGSWSCQGKMNETPMNPAGPFNGKVSVKRDLGGFWQSGSITATIPNMPPFEGRFHTTWDAGKKQFAMLWFDNMGAWAQSHAPGWQGDSITYEGTSRMGAQTMKTRDVFTKQGPSTMKHAWGVEMNGKWIDAGEETCTKS